jgi:hypothetical protein
VNSAPELDPCRHCGAFPSPHWDFDYEEIHYQCDYCLEESGSGKTLEEAAEEWNLAVATGNPYRLTPCCERRPERQGREFGWVVFCDACYNQTLFFAFGTTPLEATQQWNLHQCGEALLENAERARDTIPCPPPVKCHDYSTPASTVSGDDAVETG